LQFQDVNEGQRDQITEEDAMQIVAFVMDIKEAVNNLIVHCEAGVSRSAGVAAAIQKYLTGDDTSIFSDKRYYPNMTCYRYVLEAFGLHISKEYCTLLQQEITDRFYEENNPI
jgi:predicted protein tyrosine phosphatase